MSSTPQTIVSAFSGDQVFVGTRTGEILVVDLSDGLYETIDAHQGRINALALFPGGRRLASAGRDEVIHLWDVPSRERVGTLSGHDRQIFSLDVAPDGGAIASGGLAGDLRIWRAEK